MRALGSDGAQERQADDVENRQARRRVWRGKVLSLCEIRHGSRFLPDNDDGRRLLVALLRLGLAVESATLRAPWLEPTELRKLQRSARRVKWDELGELVLLTYEERRAARAWFMWPHGMSKNEVRRLQAETNRESERKRKREKRRDEREAKQTMNNRDDVILKLLSMKNWTPVSALVRDVGDWRAFCRPDGRRARPCSLRMLVHRTLKLLEQHGVVETKLRPGMRGRVRVARKIDLEIGAKPDGFCYGNNVTRFPVQQRKQKMTSGQRLGA
jgi:hypothetical protein